MSSVLPCSTPIMLKVSNFLHKEEITESIRRTHGKYNFPIQVNGINGVVGVYARATNGEDQTLDFGLLTSQKEELITTIWKPSEQCTNLSWHTQGRKLTLTNSDGKTVDISDSGKAKINASGEIESLKIGVKPEEQIAIKPDSQLRLKEKIKARYAMHVKIVEQIVDLKQ